MVALDAYGIQVQNPLGGSQVGGVLLGVLNRRGAHWPIEVCDRIVLCLSINQS